MRGKLISAIHVAKRELALDDETYTSALLAATGKTSCRDMSPDELSRVLDVFKKRGFKVRQNPVNRALKPGTVTAKIRAIWKVMHRQGFITDGAETALNRWVKSQTPRRTAAKVWQTGSGWSNTPPWPQMCWSVSSDGTAAKCWPRWECPNAR